MSMDEAGAAIALNALSAVGPATFQRLRARFGSCAAVFGVGEETLKQVEGVGPKAAAQVAACDPGRVAERERETARKRGAFIVTLFEEGYPRNLRAAHQPPPALYVAGTLREEDALAVAVVGTRGPTPYGKIMAENFSAALSRRGLAIVSGMARGVDTTAHRAAIDAGGRTIAVLGSGLDVCYPPENRDIYARIAGQGAVVSQFPFGTEPDKRNFPIRNRTISGLSLGVLVIEAGEKSGAAITAYGALDEGREVFALPGRIDSAQSVGCNRLIQRGAKLVTSPDDVVSEFPPEVQAALSAPSGKGAVPLSPDAEKLAALLGSGELHIDQLIDASGLSSSVALGLLLELELGGVVRQLPGKLFALVRS